MPINIGSAQCACLRRDKIVVQMDQFTTMHQMTGAMKRATNVVSFAQSSVDQCLELLQDGAMNFAGDGAPPGTLTNVSFAQGKIKR
mmetsp:Transcript_22007/g.61179  ORF Transcript_22007/g.61179 Transcript_22007/m.61179 type:complete len:86 (-) Transcript_22007:505-762(-)